MQNYLKSSQIWVNCGMNFLFMSYKRDLAHNETRFTLMARRDFSLNFSFSENSAYQLCEYDRKKKVNGLESLVYLALIKKSVRTFRLSEDSRKYSHIWHRLFNRFKTASFVEIKMTWIHQIGE